MWVRNLVISLRMHTSKRRTIPQRKTNKTQKGNHKTYKLKWKTIGKNINIKIPFISQNIQTHVLKIAGSTLGLFLIDNEIVHAIKIMWEFWCILGYTFTCYITLNYYQQIIDYNGSIKGW